ncbi:hypothetical protein F8M41_000220 [Gigaspora margarita]|uniref:Uncharacterized protein n=1 Tax=Gigaspora margarita TaxID=4874 RepID=A0A8H3XHY1_GIGMA|nr:hypothetical protein F8M41_000220 [Gigaspora margarita]
MFKNYEWELLEKLVEIFKPFDNLTTYFSGAQYTTLSVINLNEGLLEEDFSDDDLDNNEEPFEPQAVTSKL